MTSDTAVVSLLGAATGVAVVHTALGPDHYLPFVMLARSRRWSWVRTLAVTAACGLGHVASSLVLGGVGVLAGLAIQRIEGLEAGRGDLAAWLLVAFGAAYALWGVRRAIRARHGIEPHAHGGHVHLHAHGDQTHRHPEARAGGQATFWALFLIFVLGPCEPLIPLFVVPVSTGSWGLAAATAVVFCVATVATMLAIVAVLLAGVRRLPLGPLERWSHALAGLVVAASGAAILWLGW